MSEVPLYTTCSWKLMPPPEELRSPSAPWVAVLARQHKIYEAATEALRVYLVEHPCLG